MTRFPMLHNIPIDIALTWTYGRLVHVNHKQRFHQRNAHENHDTIATQHRPENVSISRPQFWKPKIAPKIGTTKAKTKEMVLKKGTFFDPFFRNHFRIHFAFQTGSMSNLEVIFFWPSFAFPLMEYFLVLVCDPISFQIFDASAKENTSATCKVRRNG